MYVFHCYEPFSNALQVTTSPETVSGLYELYNANFMVPAFSTYYQLDFELLRFHELFFIFHPLILPHF